MPSDFDTNAADDGIQTLPADAQELYHSLTREGAAWRANTNPEVARVNQRLQARIMQLNAARPIETSQAPRSSRIAQPLVTVSARRERSPHGADRAAQTPARFGGVRRWLATGATLAVVIAFLAVLSQTANYRPTGSAQQGVTGTAHTSAAPTGWTDLTRLDSSASFSANDPTAIAPSDPKTVYETMAQGWQQQQPASMRATSDGGATWRTLALPVPASHIVDAGMGVSPANARIVFLSLIDTAAADCPANRLESNSEGTGNGQFCRLQFTSVNGGASWAATNLPLADGAHAGLLTASINAGMAGPIQSATVRAQGSRLFAGFLCTNFACSRLVTSSDGGLSWSFTDQALLAGGAANVCDYTASVTSSTLYVVTSAIACTFQQQAPLTLWTSADAGATWTKVTQLARPNERGMVLAQSSATGAALLYMGMPRTTSLATDKMGDKYPVFSEAPGDVRVSVDGGTTWQNAPTQGIPADHAVFLQVGLLGALRDGSVVVDVIPGAASDAGGADNFNGSDLYAWRPGDAAWQKLTSVPSEIDGLLITPAQSGAADTFYAVLVNRGGSGTTFAVIKQDIAR
ncbi:MAG TPA: sialidase family protein [Ktedonobacterales bacterium]